MGHLIFNSSWQAGQKVTDWNLWIANVRELTIWAQLFMKIFHKI